jgi:hypothetical protein
MEISPIKRENFDWKTYLKKYKDIKDVNDEESAWKHWTNKGKKQGRKFYTLTPDENNNFYILTKEYKKRKNNDKKNYNVSCLTEDIVITDYVNDLKKKIHKIRKNQNSIKEKENENKVLLTEVNMNNNVILNEKHIKSDIKQVKQNKKQVKPDVNISKINDKKVNLGLNKEEWSNKSENSEIFFIETNKDEKWDNNSEKSELFFDKLKNDCFSSDKEVKSNK